MTDPTVDAPRPGPRPVPGERRLAHPPSDRYRTAEPTAAVDDPAASTARGISVAVVAAIAGAGAITVLGGVLAVTSGLLVVAGATGWAVAVGLRIGAGRHLAGRRGRRLAIAIALGAVTAGQVGLWLYARSEGGVLGPLDYLAEVFGPLVPLELLAAWVAAWAAAR